MRIVGFAMMPLLAVVYLIIGEAPREAPQRSTAAEQVSAREGLEKKPSNRGKDRLINRQEA
jgi:hypothetical protein